MYVLGINCWLHDSAVCLIKDGQIVAAIEEERWYRDDKHTSVFPLRSIKFCIEQANDPGIQIDHVALNIAPLRAFNDAGGLTGSLRPSVRSQINKKTHKHLASFVKKTKREISNALRGLGLGRPGELHTIPHHEAHAASAFFVSPFEEAAVLTIDGRGEWATTSGFVGRGNTLERLFSVGLPHSVGGVYAAFTDFLGFKRNNDEYKVMGLASYGDPTRHRALMRELIRPTPEGFELATEHFEDRARDVFVGEAIQKKVGFPVRERESELKQEHKDLAAALQERTEEIGVHLATLLHQKTGLTKLGMAGGVALNCVMNQRILEDTPFEELYIQPAAYDAGGAVGAAYWVYHQELKRPRAFVMDRANFGPEFEDDEIEAVLKAGLLRYRKVDDIAVEAAKLIADGQIVGWFQGRGEFGPRALGHRSILADPTNPTIQDHVNNRVKHREDFRPFAPSAVEERFGEMFASEHLDPFMVTVVPVREEMRERLPAITHVDGTARLQTVSQKTNPLYHRLITEFAKLRELPVVLNTSFNVRGEPMVCTPKDALRCFFTTGIDHLAIGSFVVDK